MERRWESTENNQTNTSNFSLKNKSGKTTLVSVYSQSCFNSFIHSLHLLWALHVKHHVAQLSLE